MPGCIEGAINSPGGGRIDDLPGHDVVNGLRDRLEYVSRKVLLFKLRLEQVALPPGGGHQQNKAVDGDAARGKDRDQTALAVPARTTRENFPLPRR